MSDAIEASSVRVQTMADSTLRLVVDIEPRFANAAFQLFGKAGTPMAIAALKVTKLDPGDMSERYVRNSGNGAHDKLKGGPLSQDAARICQTPEFRAFMCGGSQMFPETEEGAAASMRSYCGIKSRAELDHDARAARLFGALMTQYREAQTGAPR